jgi:hypothetical protein
MILVAALAVPVLAQDTNMEILKQKVKADKKLVVAANMNLTEAEAKGFWPVYESYQKDLALINERLAKTITAYADAYNNKTLTDAKAHPLIDEAIAIEEAEAKLRRTYLPKLSAVLPAVKVARYLQIENKIRAAIRYDLATGIPLAP